MVKTIKVIHLAPGESILITAAPAPTPPCPAAGSCAYTCSKPKPSSGTLIDQPPKEFVALVRVQKSQIFRNRSTKQKARLLEWTAS